MPNTAGQKARLLYLAKIFLEQTDDEHGMTREEISAELRQYGIILERKSFYSDISALSQFGLDIIREQRNRSTYYSIGVRRFELAELKLLVDAVQSSKFITEKKSRQLIKKLESLTSKYEARELQRQVLVQGRIKTMNESIYYNVDKIHQAVAGNKRIQFQYYRWTVDKKTELRHGGRYYVISPWELVWDNENYYLVGYDSVQKIIKHFRVDKMVNISLDEEKREGREFFAKDRMTTYTSKHFGMFDGDEMDVSLICENDLVGVIIDRFGKKTSIKEFDGEHFTTDIRVSVSDQFIGWILGLGEGVRVVKPDSLVERIRNRGEQILKMYK